MSKILWYKQAMLPLYESPWIMRMVGRHWLSSEMKLWAVAGLGLWHLLSTEQPQCMAGAVHRVGRRKRNRRLLISAAKFCFSLCLASQALAGALYILLWFCGYWDVPPTWYLDPPLV